MSEKTALVILMNGVEELEAVAPVDCLRRAGVQVWVASAAATTGVEGRNGIHLRADVSLDDCLGQPFDLVVVPGGPGHSALAEDSRVLELLKFQDSRDGLIGSICAGPVVLDKAGVLAGKAFTSFPGTAGQLPGRDPVSKVVRDRNIITSQGAGTAVPFALALVEALCGTDVARQVAGSICH